MFIPLLSKPTNQPTNHLNQQRLTPGPPDGTNALLQRIDVAGTSSGLVGLVVLAILAYEKPIWVTFLEHYEDKENLGFAIFNDAWKKVPKYLPTCWSNDDLPW